MKNVTLFVSTLALAALVACGSKSKPEETTPEPERVAPSRAPEPAPEPEPSVAPAEGPSASLAEIIYFEFDSSELDEASRRALTENYNWLNEDASRTITIEGHTDEVGTAEYNLGLGERRARSAKDYLVRMGIDRNRISVITYGEERPASAEDALNRRSVFVATRR
jgi:peptidoglycan-associated lipoprotein